MFVVQYNKILFVDNTVYKWGIQIIKLLVGGGKDAGCQVYTPV